MVERNPLGIHYAAQQALAQRYAQATHTAKRTPHTRFIQTGYGNIRQSRDHAGATGETMDIAGRHQECTVP